MDNRREIKQFLTSRRARLHPQTSGLPAVDDRRRVPGLKREEVALLAGISVDYYARLERGQIGGVSTVVLDAIAEALQLDDAERQHLSDLVTAAGTPERTLRSRQPRQPVLRTSIRDLVDGMTHVPAYVRNGRTDIVYANGLCLALYDGVLQRDEPFNLARFVFLDGRAHGFFIDWDEVADSTVAALRAEAGRNPLDKPLTDLVGELTTRSHPFATRWARHDVRLHGTATKRLHNSVIDDIELTGDALEITADGLTLIAYTAAAGTAAAEKLALLASWTLTQRPGVASAGPQPGHEHHH